MAEVQPVYTPEIWAVESLRVLRLNLIVARLVHTDFDSQVANMGDTVNTRKPDLLTVRDWAGQQTSGGLASDQIDVQRPTATNVAVILNKRKYTAFIEEDFEASISIKDLSTEFIEPAIIPIAEQVDTDVISELLTGTDGAGASIATVNTLAATLVADDIISVRTALENTKAPQVMRRLVMGTEHTAEALTDALFVQVDQSGGTEALREARLGRKFGFDTFESNNIPLDTATGTLPQSLGFHRNAVTLTTRPLRQIPQGLGAQSAVEVDPLTQIGIRFTRAYDTRAQGIVNVFTMLYGTKLLDADIAKKLIG